MKLSPFLSKERVRGEVTQTLYQLEINDISDFQSAKPIN